MNTVQTAPVRQWHIYKITSPSGKVYVGKTCDIKRRLKEYASLRCKNQVALYNSFIKYGYASHSVDILDAFESDMHFANGKEMFWIRTYMSHEPKWKLGLGMNLLKGGASSVGVYKGSKGVNGKIRKYVSLIRVKKIKVKAERAVGSGRTKGFKHSEESRKKISDASKGNKHNLGRKHPFRSRGVNLTRQNPSGNKRGVQAGTKRGPYKKSGKPYRKRSSDTVLKQRKIYSINNSKAIIQFSLNGEIIKEFPAVSMAARSLGFDSQNISKNLHGKTKTSHGFIFKFK